MKNIKIVTNFKVKKSEYDFGVVRTISVGIDYHIVIDPKQWEEIAKLGSEENITFKDEQKEEWEVWLDEDNNFTFFHRKFGDLITVKSADLL